MAVAAKLVRALLPRNRTTASGQSVARRPAYRATKIISLGPMGAVVADQRVGRTVVFQVWFGYFEFRDDFLRESFAEFYAPLIE